MKTKKSGFLRNAVRVCLWAWFSSAGAQAASLPRSSVEVYQEMRAWIEVHGASHVYAGPKIGDDFFCFDPSKCRDPNGPADPVNPVMDHLASLGDEFIVRTFQETLGSSQMIFRGQTALGEPCDVDLRLQRVFAEIGGKPYDDTFRADWNEDGYWWRFSIQALEPGYLEILSQPEPLKRAAQRLFSPRHSEAQRFEMRRRENGILQISIWVNYSEPHHLLDWRRKKVVCQF